MAIVTGVNAGFVTVAPTVDPSGTDNNIVRQANGIKVTSPIGDYKVTELGWYQSLSGTGINWEMALYDDDAGNNKPGNLLGTKVIGTVTGAGWYSAVYDLTLASNTAYWIVVQCDPFGGAVAHRYATTGGQRLVTAGLYTQLPDPYPTPDNNLANWNSAFYALYEPSGGTVHQLSASIVSRSHVSGNLTIKLKQNIDTIKTAGIISRKLLSTGIIDRKLLTSGIIARELVTAGTVQRKLQTTGDLE